MDTPKIVHDLVAKFNGNHTEAADAAGIHITSLKDILRGKRRLTDDMRAKFEVALAAPVKRPSLDPTTIPKKGQPRFKATYNDPPLLLELLAKYNGRRNRAAAAMGFSTPSLINDWGTGKRPFDELAQERVRRALKGDPPPSTIGEEEPDTYKLGLVCTVFPAANFERAIETADVMSGKLIFKQQVRTEWIGIFKMPEDKARIFKRLMARDAMRITCP